MKGKALLVLSVSLAIALHAPAASAQYISRQGSYAQEAAAMAVREQRATPPAWDWPS